MKIMALVIYFENQVRYTDEHFTNVVNEVTSLLDEGLVVEISGRIVKSNVSTIEEYDTLLYIRAQFDSYYIFIIIHITYKIKVILKNESLQEQ